MSQDRIEFYEQVLELEPGSKLFYALARLYYEHDDLEKARKILESGLEKHPEHIQAKLLLASVMDRSGDLSAARGAYLEIFDRVLGSQEFWSGLAAALREEGRSEPALAAAFFSSWLAEPSLTWSRVFQNGLDSLKGPDTSSVSPDEPSSAQLQPEPGETSTDGEEPEIVEYKPLYEKAGIQQKEPQELDRDSISWEEEFDEPEEVKDISFEDDARTRSMADLLAAQEEYQKALDIYKELWIRSLPGPERQELEVIISGLNQTLDLNNEPDQKGKYVHGTSETEKKPESESASPEPKPDAKDPSDSGLKLNSQKAGPVETFSEDKGNTEKSEDSETQGKNEMMSFLSRLAERLDQSRNNHG
ncbi:tetratricopeptide repeat protein [Desulfonatronospira sp.]|uniref:tetratricopeptide repeat protein n=1 Tax=Desulfonatronospira sp. TaxID=1962951 RepID=UPI0025C501F8|nr:tetratricopeptide repeat protein [Desulfonatronospira sp.]